MNQILEETTKVNMNETQRLLVMNLAEDFAPFVSKIENGIATTKNNYGAYGAMLSKLSKGDRKLALIFAYALKIAGANAVGVSDAINAFFQKTNNKIIHIMTTTEIKLCDTDYVWFDGSNIDMGAIYAEESMLKLLNEWEKKNVPPVGGEKFIKMTELPIDIQNDFIHKIKINTL